MSLVRTVGFCACLAVLAAGCRTAQPFSWGGNSAHSANDLPQAVAQVVPVTAPTAVAAPAAVTPVVYQQPLGSDLQLNELPSPIAASGAFTLPEFLAEVQARN